MRIAISVGERSGDDLAAGIAEALRRREPGIRLIGVTGPRMREAGVETLADVDALGVMGLFEVVRHLPRLVALRRRLRAQMLDARIDAFVGVDAPDFNLGLARQLRRRGITTLQVVAPSVWAWRRYRIPKIARSLDGLLTLFPFEPPLFADHDLQTHCIGHPLADALPVQPDRAAARAALELDPGRPVVALLPGSRSGEIARHAGLLTELAERLNRTPEVQVLLLLADARHREAFAAAAGHAPRRAGMRVVTGRTRTGLMAADAAAAASGTVTLEALLCGTPMTVFYRLPPATYALARGLRLVRSQWISLPNVLAGETLVPERIQSEARPEVLAADLAAWLDDPERTAAFRRRAERLHADLARSATERAADHILAAAANPRAW